MALTKDQIVEIGKKYGVVKLDELAQQMNMDKGRIMSMVQRLRRAGVNIPKRSNSIDFKEAVYILKKKLNVKGA